MSDRFSDFYVPALVLHPSGLEDADGASEVFKFPFEVAILILDVTDSNGTTELLDVTIEEFDSASSTFFEIAAFTQATAGTTFERILLNEDFLAPFGSLVRAVWDLEGTGPDFTFSVSMHGKK